MKTFLLSLSLFAAATSAFASEDLSRVVATVANVNDKIQAVTLTQGGKLEVILRERHREISRQLTQANTDKLVFDASLLANAELTTQHKVVVCMMMVNPMFMTSLSVAPYDENAGQFIDGAAKLVLSPTSCAISSETFPADRNAYATAVSLKETLVALGSEAYAKNLAE